jgi:hypothetical protein
MISAAPDDVCSSIKDLGWRCGSVMPVSFYPSVRRFLVQPENEAPTELKDDDWLVVISHSCDVTAVTMEHEPFVEVLHCRHIETPQSQFKNRRSTRRLHLRPNKAALPNFYLDAHATADRYMLPRRVLAGCAPCEARTLGQEAIDGIQAWYALRCQRPAWPDNLNIRLAPVRDKLEKALKSLDDEATEIRVSISFENDRLRLAVFLIVDEDIWNGDAEKRQNAIFSFQKFIAILEKCEGIEVDMELSRPINGAEFSWQDMRSTDSWNFANLTPIDKP